MLNRWNLAILFALAIGCHLKATAEGESDTAKVTVQIIHKSRIPDPAKSDYPDCLYTAEARVLEIQSELRAPRELILALPAFNKRTLAPDAAFVEGQILEVEIISNEKAEKALKTQQRSDTQERFDLQVFYTLSTRPIEKKLDAFATQPDSYFENGKKPLMVAEPIRYPWSAKAASDRKTAMEADKQVILQALKNNGGNWKKWDAKLRPFYADLAAQAKADPDGQLLKGQFHFQRIRYIPYADLCKTSEAGEPGPLKMLSSLNQQLRARGIDLIVVPFPNKEDIHADVFSKLAPADGWFLPYRQKFLLDLLEADIEMIDLIQPLRAARSRFPSIFYPEHDHHPADGAIQVAAEEIAKRLERYEFKKQPGFQPLQLSLKPVEIKKEQDDKTFLSYPATRVVTSDGEPLVTPSNSGSPVIIMGDSFTIVPVGYSPEGVGAALPMHIAYQSGVLPNYLSNKGSSDKAMRMLAREGGDYLAHRAVLIFAFAPNRLFGQDSQQAGEEAWNLVDLPPLPLGN